MTEQPRGQAVEDDLGDVAGLVAEQHAQSGGPAEPGQAPELSDDELMHVAALGSDEARRKFGVLEDEEGATGKDAAAGAAPETQGEGTEPGGGGSEVAGAAAPHGNNTGVAPPESLAPAPPTPVHMRGGILMTPEQAAAFDAEVDHRTKQQAAHDRQIRESGERFAKMEARLDQMGQERSKSAVEGRYDALLKKATAELGDEKQAQLIVDAARIGDEGIAEARAETKKLKEQMTASDQQRRQEWADGYDVRIEGAMQREVASVEAGGGKVSFEDLKAEMRIQVQGAISGWEAKGYEYSVTDLEANEGLFLARASRAVLLRGTEKQAPGVRVNPGGSEAGRGSEKPAAAGGPNQVLRPARTGSGRVPGGVGGGKKAEDGGSRRKSGSPRPGTLGAMRDAPDFLVREGSK